MRGKELVAIVDAIGVAAIVDDSLTVGFLTVGSRRGVDGEHLGLVQPRLNGSSVAVTLSGDFLSLTTLSLRVVS
ncbi:hypothetical protein TIFTF001_033281 [Ficus carica]|uniref:Uncharacterized protein n=1 Tax=Ficus carica TaxID=3494 RepID=A0AA88DYM7_FICCA|nr:hypothetical protein TIFTF001_033281 [Ficus carica]